MNAKSLVSLALVSIAAALFTGCATNEQFVPLPDQSTRVENPQLGRIYVMRPTSFGYVSSMEVWDGDRHIGNTGPESYLCWERQPGEAKVIGKEENESVVELNVESNQVYYIFQHVRMGWAQARNKLEAVNEEEGKTILKRCKPPKIVKEHP